MKKFLQLTLVCTLLLGSTSLFAQKFGRVNMQEIVVAMPEFKEMQTNLETFRKDLITNLETIQVELNNRIADYQKNEVSFSESIKQLKQKEIGDLQNRLQEFQENAQLELQQKQNELLEPVVTKARNAISKVSQAGSFTVVFDTSMGSLAYFDEAALTDIASEVQKELGI
ncbi:MAG: OmpH family outer membrane protein [Alistipes sp.]|jgi:outer membrane protein|uniref:OmpH family outer membrane protein n=2 Tax=Alistipes sp. TaxID=1872444 RepID=UPI001D4EA0C3|nr:OmpH family outer membrane protein [Alistipes sp.]MBS6100878.1 OmpH family outer membrane protein [Alistipes sp.]HJI19650.1 OmpH family outer membrane protein [Rikenellaceae bacterium]